MYSREWIVAPTPLYEYRRAYDNDTHSPHLPRLCTNVHHRAWPPHPPDSSLRFDVLQASRLVSTTFEPGLLFVICLLILAGNLLALYEIIRLAVTHALDVQRKRAEARPRA